MTTLEKSSCDFSSFYFGRIKKDESQGEKMSYLNFNELSCAECLVKIKDRITSCHHLGKILEGFSFIISNKEGTVGNTRVDINRGIGVMRD